MNAETMTPERVVLPIAVWSRPPGIVMLGILAALLLVILESASRLAELLPVFAWTLVSLIGLVWVVKLAAALRNPGARDARSWVRWLLVPAMVAATLLVVVLDVPFAVRLELGREAMTAEAEAYVASPDPGRTTFGLLPAESITVYAGDLTFTIGGSGFFDSVALTYAPDGPPPEPYEGVARDLGGGWWLWVVPF